MCQSYYAMYVSESSILDKQQFENHVEFLTYVYNSCMANGCINDGIELVRSQKRLMFFDYPFAFKEGLYIVQ